MRFLVALASALAVARTAEAASCSSESVSFFLSNLNTASDGCALNAGYNWSGNADPTTDERTKLCECDVEPLEVPKCTIKKLQYDVAVSEHVGFVLNCTGKTAPQITEVAVNSSSPSSSSSSSTACSGDDIRDFMGVLELNSNQCTQTLAYNWSGPTNPNAQEVALLCSCTIDTFNVPNCTVTKGPDVVTLDTHYHWILNQCPAKTTAPSTSSGSNAGTIGGIAGGVVAALVVVALVVFYLRKKRSKKEASQGPMPSPAYHAAPVTDVSGKSYTNPRPSGASTGYTTITTTNGSVQVNTNGTGPGTNGSGGYQSAMAMWNDPMIIAMRIPHDAIFFGSILSRGAYGEVYRGVYKGETVAIKQLLPERRKDMGQIEDFLGEAKLMSNLEHERIVKFIGVAWNSLSDACMVVEYMANGDLRSVLNRWNNGEESRSNGFDADKVKIALHVAHALVYLHSLQPIVVHRDLKSKNILLDANFDAKITDFGVSREHEDSTMTAGVGSSLWMAPEVMMGERYNEKADIFSFGVVLSEIDTHQLPYFQAKQAKMPEAAIMQQVMLGRLTVAFTDNAHPELAQLGRDCVAVNPKDRPTAAQVLHRVHMVFRQHVEVL